MPKHTRAPLTDEQREQRRAEQRTLVEASIEQLRSSDGWQAYLKARRTFHGYSLGNILLILSQHETATRVAGFKAWLKLGYAVTKGSTSIKIWAPCPPSRKQLEQWRRSGADPDTKPRTHWRLASVFAQDQVAPLPPPAAPAPLDPPGRELVGNTHAELIAPLISLAGELGYTVVFDSSPRGEGYCNFTRKVIAIAERLAPNARLQVLIHELGHALLRTEPEAAALSYAQEEIVVESIALCAGQLVELDTSENSIPYLASWAESASLDVLEATAKVTDRVARRIEDRLLAAETATIEPGEEHPLDSEQAMAA
jgi:GAF domain-containing protein